MKKNYKVKELNDNSRFLVIYIAIFFVNTAIADEYHYNNTLIGDRAVGLGGAYTAISDDASGLFYNPAGIVFSDDLKLTGSAHAYHSTTKKYKGVLGGGDWTRESSSLIPNFFGMTNHLGDDYFGFSYAVPDSIIENQDSRFTNLTGISDYIVNVDIYDNTTLLGVSYATALSDTLNFGVTFYLHTREKKLTTNQWIQRTDNRFEWSNIYNENEETGYLPILGLLWSPDDTMSVGLTLRKTFIKTSKTSIQRTCVSDLNLVGQAAECQTVVGFQTGPAFLESPAKRRFPTQLTLGLAYFPTNKLLYSADLNYYEAVSDPFFDKEAILNIAFGVEYYVSKTWILRGGVFTNNANTPDIKVTEVNQPEHTDLRGVSVSLSQFTKSSSFTVGFVSASGSGQSQVVAGVTEIQDQEQESITLYLSSSTKF